MLRISRGAWWEPSIRGVTNPMPKPPRIWSKPFAVSECGCAHGARRMRRSNAKARDQIGRLGRPGIVGARSLMFFAETGEAPPRAEDHIAVGCAVGWLIGVGARQSSTQRGTTCQRHHLHVPAGLVVEARYAMVH